MNKLINIICNTDQPMRSYVWKVALVSLIPSLILSAIVTVIAPEEGPEFDSPDLSVVFGVLILSPWLETLLMIPIFGILKRFIPSTIGRAVASALIWAILHSLAAPAWGFAIVWAFFVFSLCFLEWEKKSRKHAILATASVHMCQNILPMIAILMSQ